MRMMFTAVGTADAGPTDVLLDADPAATISDVAARLGLGSETSLYVGDTRLDPAEALAHSPLRYGSVLRIGRPDAQRPDEPAGLVEVRVVSGPSSGRIYRLGAGEFEIGSDRRAAIRLPDEARVAGRCLRLRITPDGQCVAQGFPEGEAQLDGESLLGEMCWRPGSVLRVGEVLIDLAQPTSPDAALQPAPEGGTLDYNRPPRVRPPAKPTRFRLPVPPPTPNRRPIPLVTALVPLVIAAGAVVFFHNLFYLLIGVFAPVTAIGSYVSNRRDGTASYQRKLAEYRDHRARIEADADAALLAEQHSRRLAAPDAALVSRAAIGPRQTLWERRPVDADFLVLRVGTATQPSSVVMEDPTQDEHRREIHRDAADVPVTVSLRQHGVVGLAGPQDQLSGLARWIVAQSVVLHSPTELQLCLLLGQDNATWDWAGWLPHVRGRTEGDPLAFIATDTESTGQRIAELSAVLAERKAGQGGLAGSATAAAAAAAGRTEILVVHDGARRLRSIPGVVQLLRDGPSVGIYSVCLEAEEGFLPEECQAIVVAEGARLRVLRTGTADLSDVRNETVRASWCRSVSRALAPLRDVTAKDLAGVIPGRSRLLDVLGLEPPEADPIMARWQLGGRSTQAIVGESLDGPFSLDLRADGPHGLVAGTTGSGKSEFLQTLVASLAVANRPDAMNFVLVDYKGGSAFKECSVLPHTVGMVTDLDPHLVERALASLSAELRRREQVLAEAGAKDIEAYIDTLRRGHPGPPLARLLIVIDEFASMARDLPGFITGIVNIAQRGRSLGIHLILATQRPAGVVSGEIRANTNLRVGLRMTDPAESIDVIGTADSAYISKATPGRAYARLGHAALLPFQSARVGGRSPTGVAAEQPPVRLVPVGWPDLSQPTPPLGEVGGDSRHTEVTDLSTLVAAIRAANDRLGLAAPMRPWLPPLAGSILLDQLAPAAAGMSAPFGLVDLPDEQLQVPATVDFATFEHLHIIGSPRSGRSQALRTIAGSIATNYSSRDVHLYGIDCGNGALLALTDLPHCGAVVPHADAERLVRLVGRLIDELTRRQTLLASNGFADLNEWRAARVEDAPAHIAVLIDRWEVLDKTYGDADGGSLIEAVLRLFREGAGAGIHIIAAGDRQLFATKVAPTTENKLLLRLNDRNDYGMAGIRVRDVPESMPAGRALRIDQVEVQIALLGPDPSGLAQGRAVQEIAERTTQRDAALPPIARPFQVRALPERVSFEDATRLSQPDGLVVSSGPMWATLGVGGDDLHVYGVDLAATPTWMVAGPGRSGRSTLLTTMAHSLLCKNTRVIVVAPRVSPLRDLDGRAGVIAVFDRAGVAPEDFEEALSSAAGPVVVFLDDAELLREASIAEQLHRITQHASGPGRALVIAGESAGLNAAFVGWLLDAKRNRQGVLLSPRDLADGDLIGIRLARSLIGGPIDPGRALLHFGDGRVVTVRVPVSDLMGGWTSK
jgi:S-DNA-T family DNA segregation ATPase FtsK/SpoIIIE